MLIASHKLELSQMKSDGKIYPTYQAEISRNKVDNFQNIGTFGAGPCSIILSHNPATKEAILSHSDDLATKFNQYIPGYLKEGDIKPTIYFAGISQSAEGQEVAEYYLMKKYIDEGYTVYKLEDQHSLAVNLQTGQVFIPFMEDFYQRKADPGLHAMSYMYNDKPIQISIPKKSDIIEEINKPRLESGNLQRATENITTKNTTNEAKTEPETLEKKKANICCIL